LYTIAARSEKRFWEVSATKRGCTEESSRPRTPPEVNWMFLFSISRRDSGRRINLPDVREFAAGDWVVSVVTDGWLSSAVGGGSGPVAVRECAPLEGGCDRLLLAEARFEARGARGPASVGSAGAAPVVELRKTLISGRQVYYHLGADGSLACATHVRLL